MPDQFLNILFPTRISQGCTCTPMFDNTTIKTKNGYRQVQINWDTPLRRFDVSHVLNNDDFRNELIHFWNDVRGSAYTFKFLDWSDYLCGLAWTINANSNDPVLVAPQNIGSTNGTVQDFQLIKTYGNVNTYNRKITKPKVDTVRIFQDTVSNELTTGWTVDETTGIVHFTSPPATGHNILVACEFYCHCAFEDDQMAMKLDTSHQGEWSGINIMEQREG